MTKPGGVSSAQRLLYAGGSSVKYDASTSTVENRPA
jgi:hypothetical protein